MKYIIFLRARVGGGRYEAYFHSGYFYIHDENGSRTIHQRDVKSAIITWK